MRINLSRAAHYEVTNVDGAFFMELITKYAKEYKISEYNSGELYTFISTNKKGIQSFIDWAKEKLELTIEFYNINEGDEDILDSLSFGFVITEDQHLTKYMLEK